MKITVINGSPRKNGNTEIMVDAFVRGAQEAGHEISVFSLSGRELHGCIGCGYCGSHGGHCVYKDGVTEIIDSTNEAIWWYLPHLSTGISSPGSSPR